MYGGKEELESGGRGARRLEKRKKKEKSIHQQQHPGTHARLHGKGVCPGGGGATAARRKEEGGLGQKRNLTPYINIYTILAVLTMSHYLCRGFWLTAEALPAESHILIRPC